jgi:cytosine/adenosine deaminase-related metal-dependent hydrolase
MPAPSRAPADFVDILKLVWWRLDRALDEAALRAAARLYIAEALLVGTTTLVDHHESPAFIEGSLDVLAEAADELGARLLVTYGATERNGGLAEAKRGLAECARFVREARFPRVKGLIGLHASFTLSDDAIRAAGELAQDLGVPVHVHVAEAEADVLDARQRGYEGPLERLIALGCLPPRSIVAHGVWLDEASVKRADVAGAWLVQNPRSNANNRVGYPHALHASARVAIGTDGFPANMTDELRALDEESTKNRDVAGPGALLARRAGGLTLAALFDEGVQRDTVSGVRGKPPREVFVDGRVVVKDGVLVHGDVNEIRAVAREQAARLWSRMATLGE